MDVLAGRVLLHPSDLARSRAFYRDLLGLAVYREFGDPENPSMVFHIGGGFLEVGSHGPTAGPGADLWLQVRSVAAESERLVTAGVPIVRPPQREPWGLDEMWIADPDGVRIVLVEIPSDHPLRRDTRSLPL